MPPPCAVMCYDERLLAEQPFKIGDAGRASVKNEGKSCVTFSKILIAEPGPIKAADRSVYSSDIPVRVMIGLFG